MTDVRRSVWAFGAAAVLMGAGLAEGAATLHRLGSLPGAPVVTSHGRALSADGSTVVGQAPTSDGPRAFAGGPGGLMNLGNLDGASDAYGASADGSVVVGNAWVEPIGFLAFRSTETGGIVSLGSIGFNSSGHEQSEALAVSADGSVVVGRSSSPAAGANFEAFRWTQ